MSLHLLGFPGCTVVKNLSANTGDTRDKGLVPGLIRFLGVGNGSPFQYSFLENSMDRGVWQATTHEVTESDETEHARIYLLTFGETY